MRSPICGADLAAAGTKPARPNILWLIAEDFGQHLGCFGTKEVWTPNLDRLAGEGVLYTRFYNGMVCSVSRSSFMTGMHATSIGAQNHLTKDKPMLPDGVRPLTGWLRDAGYFTANLVQMPASCGFEGSGKTDWNFRSGAKPFDSSKWDDLKSHQPFYAQVNFDETHRPFHAKVFWTRIARTNTDFFCFSIVYFVSFVFKDRLFFLLHLFFQ